MTGAYGCLQVQRKLHVVTLALCLLAAPVAAEEHSFRLPIAVLAAAGTADIASTMVIARANGRDNPGSGTENNPLINWMEPTMGTGGMLTVSAALEVGAFWIACRALCKNHPKLMKSAFLIGGLAHGMAATGNVLNHRDAESRRKLQGR